MRGQREHRRQKASQYEPSVESCVGLSQQERRCGGGGGGVALWREGVGRGIFSFLLRVGLYARGRATSGRCRASLGKRKKESGWLGASAVMP